MYKWIVFRKRNYNDEMIRVISFICKQQECPSCKFYKNKESTAITCIEPNDIDNFYDAYYESDICVAECIRNICVNLNIDPNTISGISNDVCVKIGNFLRWSDVETLNSSSDIVYGCKDNNNVSLIAGGNFNGRNSMHIGDHNAALIDVQNQEAQLCKDLVALYKSLTSPTSDRNGSGFICTMEMLDLNSVELTPQSSLHDLHCYCHKNLSSNIKDSNFVVVQINPIK